MSHITRKPVFGVSDLVRLKPACSGKEASKGLEISAIASRGIILSRQRTTKALIRLRRWAGWSVPLLYAYGKNRFSHDVTHIFQLWNILHLRENPVKELVVPPVWQKMENLFLVRKLEFFIRYRNGNKNIKNNHKWYRTYGKIFWQ